MSKKEDPDALRSYSERYIREAVEQTSTYSEAAAHLEKEAREDKMLWRSLTEPLLSRACMTAVREHGQHERRKVWKSTADSTPQHGDRLAAAMVALMDFRLVNGKRIAEANKIEVLDSAVFYDTQSRDMAAKAVWLRRVAEKLGDGDTVGNALSEQDLRKLRGDD